MFDNNPYDYDGDVIVGNLDELDKARREEYNRQQQQAYEAENGGY